MTARKAPAAPVFEPPVDHAELCARVRFSLDELARLSDEELREREAAIQSMRTEVRRQGIRATPSLLPRIHRLTREACQKLQLEKEPEVYVVAHPELNALAMACKDGTPFVVLHNGLVQILDDAELLAVIAHELGHAGLRHASRAGSSYAANVYGTQRTCAGEVSADRVAMVVTGSPKPIISGLIKMSCGLGASELSVDIDAVMEQFAHPENNQEDEDGPDSHPELPFRHWALTRFAASDIFHSLMGKPGGEPFEEIEQEIEDRFHALDEGLAFRTTSDLVHEAVAWLGVMLVAHDDKVDEKERKVLGELVGRIWTEDACNYARRNGLAAVERRAREILEHLKYSGVRTRQRVTEIVREIGERSGNKAKVNETLSFVASTFGIR